MISKKEIQKVVNTIVKIAKPEKIMLFGSYASGKPDDGSDLDFLIIMDKARFQEHSRKEWDWLIRMGVYNQGIPVDLILRTKEDVEKWKDVPGTIIYTTFITGRVIYERKGRKVSRAVAK